jgi:hypothetical protein
MKKDLNIGAYIIAFAAFLWSLDALIRVSLYSLPPTVVVFWEHLLGAILLTPFAFKHRDEIKQLTKKEWGAVLIISLFSWSSESGCTVVGNTTPRSCIRVSFV